MGEASRGTRERYPWYESKWIGGHFALAIAIIGLVVPMRELRWMLGFLPLVAIWPILHVAKNIGRGIGTIEIFIFLLVPYTYGLWNLSNS